MASVESGFGGRSRRNQRLEYVSGGAVGRPSRQGAAVGIASRREIRPVVHHRSRQLLLGAIEFGEESNIEQILNFSAVESAEGKG